MCIPSLQWLLLLAGIKLSHLNSSQGWNEKWKFSAQFKQICPIRSTAEQIVKWQLHFFVLLVKESVFLNLRGADEINESDNCNCSDPVSGISLHRSKVGSISAAEAVKSLQEPVKVKGETVLEAKQTSPWTNIQLSLTNTPGREQTPTLNFPSPPRFEYD